MLLCGICLIAINRGRAVYEHQMFLASKPQEDIYRFWQKVHCIWMADPFFELQYN